MSVYYPSCTVHLRVRFDEAFRVDETKEPRSPSSMIGSVSSTSRSRNEFVTAPETERPLVTNPEVVVQNGVNKTRGRLNSILNRVPLSCSVELPSYRAAGTFKLEIEYADLPIDPRLVRSASAEIYMGVVDPLDFATGMVSVEPDGSRRSILQTVGPANQRIEKYLMMVAQVDTWHVTHSASGSRVAMEGRDMRSILIDTEIDVRAFKDIKLDRDIVNVVQDIKNLHPFGQSIQVFYDKEDFTDSDGKVTLPKVVASPFNKVRQQVASGNNISKPAGGEKLNFWDLITKYCFLTGCVPFFRADRLIIRRSVDLYQQMDQDREGTTARTPFAGGRQRETEDGEKFGVRRVVYGRDVAEHSFERKLTGIKTPIVEVVGQNLSSKDRGDKTFRVRWPEKDTAASSSADSTKKGKDKVVAKVGSAKKTSISVSGTESETETIRIPVSGITDKEQLLGIAKAVYEEIARGEMGGSIKTKSLASFGTGPDPTSGNRDPDLIRLRPGDAVEILVDTRNIQSQAPNVSSYTDSVRRTFEEEVAALQERLGSSGLAPDMARVIVAQSRGGILQLQTFFRVGNASFEWAKDSGISISFDFQNYVEARHAVAPTKKEKASVKTTLGPSVMVTSEEENKAQQSLDEVQGSGFLGRE